MFAWPVSGDESVHPRRRGEHSSSNTSKTQSTGSSPQARGTLRRPRGRRARGRFIPAGAGNTQMTVCAWSPGSVHPRRRGEHVHEPEKAISVGGSSPQARGTRWSYWRRGHRWRFIPAGAGNTTPAESPSEANPVHPRRRGEHSTEDEAGCGVRGSSPQARGTQPVQKNAIRPPRFIPAGAGEH